MTLGLSIHAAELTTFSGLARLMTAQVSRGDGFSDALFEANDPETWRSLLRRWEQGERLPSHHEPSASPSTPETFLPTVLLAQSIVNVYKVRELLRSPMPLDLPDQTLSHFYDYMMPMAFEFGVLRHPQGFEAPVADMPSHLRSISALWHYACALRLTPMSDVENVAGRGGNPPEESIREVQTWANTPLGRLASLHAGYVLHYAADLRDLAFLIPR